MKLSSHQSGKYSKLILIGDSGAGKTGSLVSLVAAGYHLKILDLDNGLSALRAFIKKDCPDKIDNVDFETLRDPIKPGANGPVVTAKAFVEATKLMTTWSDGSDPSKGGEDEIFVLDSTTTLGKMAYEWAKAMAPSAKDPRQWYFAAQQAFENIIGMLTATTYENTDEETGKTTVYPGFDANLIVIAHVNYKELVEGISKGYPTAVGSALGPTIPKYFDVMVQAEVTGTGKNAARKIRTVPTGIVDLKNPAPFRIEAEYPINDGMARLFEQLKS